MTSFAPRVHVHQLGMDEVEIVVVGCLGQVLAAEVLANADPWGREARRLAWHLRDRTGVDVGDVLGVLKREFVLARMAA